MKKEPYIVCVIYGMLYRYYPVLHLFIIRWSDKAIYDKIITSRRPLKKLTRNQIEKVIDPAKFKPDKIPGATLENIKDVVEKLEGCRLSYIYFIY